MSASKYDARRWRRTALNQCRLWLINGVIHLGDNMAWRSLALQWKAYGVAGVAAVAVAAARVYSMGRALVTL